MSLIDHKSGLLELPNAAGPAQPAYWQLAPMPQAAVCVVEDSALIDVSTAERVPLSARLERAFDGGDSGTTVIAVDATGEFWRLRRTAAPQIWLVQSLAASRLLLMEELRSNFASRLANSILHELRNPLNALTLQCDLLARTWKTATDAGEASAARIAQMKDRLRDLNERQNAVASLWLAPLQEQEPAPLQPLDNLLDGILRLLRNHCAQRELRLAASDLATLASLGIGLGAAALQLALVAAVIWSGDVLKSATNAGGEIQVQASIDDRGKPLLKLSAPLAARRDPLDSCGGERRWATLALFLEKFAIKVDRLPEGGVQFVVTAPVRVTKSGGRRAD